MIGADYSVGRPGGAALAAAGVQAVGRYAAAGRTSINITAAEVDDLRAHGIDVFIYNEHEASYMLGGAARAATVVPGAVKVCQDAGLPDGVIFYAVDWDATLGGPPVSAAALGNMAKLADFLTAAAQVTGWEQVGVYGGFYVVQWLLDHLPNLEHAVQTSAWSAGHWDTRAFARQDGYGWMIAGVDCDHLTITNPDEGSLRYRGGAVAITSAEFDRIRQIVREEAGRAVHNQQLYADTATDGTKVTVGYVLDKVWRSLGREDELSPQAVAAVAQAVVALEGAGAGGSLTVPDVEAALRNVLTQGVGPTPPATT